MGTPRFEDVLNQMVAQTVAAINAADVPNPTQIGIGNYLNAEIQEIIQAGGYQVTFFQRPGSSRSTMRYPFRGMFPIGNPVTTLSANVVAPNVAFGPWSIDFSGQSGSGAFITAIVGNNQAATYQCAPNESLATSIAGIAAAINALGIAGTTASVSGNVVLVAGSPMCACRVNGTGYVVAQEVNRFTCTVQATLAIPGSQLRFSVRDVIESAVGTFDQPFLTLSDGTKAFCVNVGGAPSGPDDDNQSSNSLYLEHLVFEVEYGVLKTYPGYPIAVVEATLQTPSGAPIPVVSGGN